MDHCSYFTPKEAKVCMTIISLLDYVNDMIITNNNTITKIEKFQCRLAKQFEKDLEL